MTDTNTETTRERPDHEDARAELQALMAALGLTIEATFVPLSRVSAERRASWSHSGKPALFLTWRCALVMTAPTNVRAAPSTILETDYSAGIGHCPAYKNPKYGRPQFMSVDRDAAVRWECEHGKEKFSVSAGRPITVEPADVFASLLMDASAIDHPSYESWAEDCGYDTDSRKGEAIYRTCLAHALALRSALGDEALTTAREIAGRM